MSKIPPEGERLRNKHIEVRVSEDYTPEELVEKYGSRGGTFGAMGVTIQTDKVYFEGYPYSMYQRNPDGSLKLSGSKHSVTLNPDEWEQVVKAVGLS